MGWRLHLSSQPVFAVQFITGDVPQLVVWDSQHNAHFYDLHDATPLGEKKFTESQPVAEPQDEAWQAFLPDLRAPGGDVLPTVYLKGVTLYQSRDGRMRLYHYQDGRLLLDIGDSPLSLHKENEGRFLVSALDRTLGLIGAYHEDGALHIFQQHVRVGTFEFDFVRGVDARLSMLAPDGRGRLIVGDGERVVIVDAGGRVEQELAAHFTVGSMAVSPNGQIIALADIDDNLIRLYDHEFRQTHQKYAIDILADARQTQLIASLPGRKAALAALDVSDDGDIAFALGGVVCVSHREALDVLPQPRPLL